MKARHSSALLFAAVALVSVAAKLWLALQGHNYDVDSYRIVADIVVRGGNVYAETYRYNYGPPWSLMLGALRLAHVHWFGASGMVGFHLLVAAVLAVVDVAIGAWAWRVFGLGSGLLFMMNPISLLISGYSSQFDNASILLALLAVSTMDSPAGSGRRHAWGLAVLGLSLSVKHVYIFFPAWLAWQAWEKSRSRRGTSAALALPLVVFVCSFVFFVRDASSLQGVWDNVISYKSSGGESLSNQVLGAFVSADIPWKQTFRLRQLAWVLALVALGFVYRKTRATESVLHYSVAVVALSPAMTDQYLAIPALAACTIMPRWAAAWFYVVGTMFLLSPASYSWHPVLFGHAIPSGIFTRVQCQTPLAVALGLDLLRRHRNGEWSWQQLKGLARTAAGR